jgi:c-di-GMP-binding flagellar brake protein YcgR
MSHSSDEMPIRINDRLQVIIKDSDEEIPTTYLSRVDDISGNDIFIAWPTSQGIRVPIRENDILTLYLTAGTAVYSANSKIMKMVRSPLPQLVVRVFGKPTKIQRREFVRVQAMIKICLLPHAEKPKSDKEEKADSAGITVIPVNISGGGFGLRHPTPFTIGDLYDIKMTIPGEDNTLALTAKVVRCELINDPPIMHAYDVGFAFVQIKESYRRDIVRFIFKRQQSSILKE